MLATVKGLAALLAETRQALLSHRLALFLCPRPGRTPAALNASLVKLVAEKQPSWVSDARTSGSFGAAARAQA